MTAGPSNLVQKIAWRLLRRVPANVERDDLVQVGWISEHQAREKFDPSKGATFDTYAGRRILGAMLDELRGVDPLGRNTRKLIKRMEVLVRADPRPSWADVALQLGVSFEDVHRLRALAGAAHIIDFMEPDDKAPGGLANGKVVEALSTDETPEVQLDAAQRRQFLHAEVERLSPPQRRVVKAYLAGTPLVEVAKQLGVTPSRVSRLLRAGTLALARSAGAMADTTAVAPPEREFEIHELLSSDIVKNFHPSLLQKSNTSARVAPQR